MAFSISYPIAKDRDGNWVTIEEAQADMNYYCPECESLFIARRGDIRVHHFAHKPGYSGICSGESAYHSLAKHLLQYHFEQQGYFPVSIRCPTCKKEKAYKEKISKIQVEKGDEEGRPDVRIYLENGTIIDCEVIYKNPLGKKFERYSANKGNLLIWNIDETIRDVPPILQGYWEDKEIWTYDKKDSSNLLFLASPPVPSSHVCKPYGRAYVFDINCWRCNRKTKVAIISSWFPTWGDGGEYSSGGWLGGEIDIEYIDNIPFDEAPVGFIKTLNSQYGTNLRNDYSKAANKYYIMNHCSHCDTKIGDWPLKEEIMTSSESMEFQEVNIDFHLSNWEREKIKSKYPESSSYKL